MKRTIALLAIAVFLPVWLLAQSPLSVKVKNENGDPLIGASVKIKGSLFSGQTNTQGEFHLKSVKSGEHVLQVSYLGYESLEKAITLPLNSTIEIVLSTESFLTDA